MMRLSKRDKAIIKDLRRFRVMDRNSIASLHFSGLKNPKYAANNVLLRLVRDGHIKRSTAFVPYVYFDAGATIKKNSAKIGHFLAILEVYKEIRRLGRLETFLVEPKYGSKGTVEPDIYAEYRRTPFFIEVQRTVYSDRQMAEKMRRYEDLYRSGIIKPFPHVLILSEQRYAIDREYPFRVFQAQTFGGFLDSVRNSGQDTSKKSTGGLRVKIG